MGSITAARRGGRVVMKKVVVDPRLERLEEEAKKNTAVSDLVDFVLGLESDIGDLVVRLERLEGEVQRLRDDVNYLLTKI